MLHDALAALLREKEFEKISIQDIADLSTLNRATFYLHYPDKITLLQCMVASRFHDLMASRNVCLGSCTGALKALALGVCDFLLDMPAVRRGGKAQVEGSMQTAIVAVVQGIVLDGINHHHTLAESVSAELLASTVAWAIYGAANTWVQMPQRSSAEQMAEVIDRLVSPVLVSGTVPNPS